MKQPGHKTETNVGQLRKLHNRQAVLGKYRRHCVADASKVGVLGLEVWVDLVERSVAEFTLCLSQRRGQLVQR